MRNGANYKEINPAEKKLIMHITNGKIASQLLMSISHTLCAKVIMIAKGGRGGLCGHRRKYGKR